MTNCTQYFLQKILGKSDQNCECWGQFSIFEATSRASYDCHLLKYDKWYPILPPTISGQSDQNCECWGQLSVFEATSRASYDCHLLKHDKLYPILPPKILGQSDQNCENSG